MATYGVCRLDTATATTERRSIVVGGVQLAAADANGERPTGLVAQLGANANEAKVFKAHAAPLGLCVAS